MSRAVIVQQVRHAGRAIGGVTWTLDGWRATDTEGHLLAGPGRATQAQAARNVPRPAAPASAPTQAPVQAPAAPRARPGRQLVELVGWPLEAGWEPERVLARLWRLRCVRQERTKTRFPRRPPPAIRLRICTSQPRSYVGLMSYADWRITLCIWPGLPLAELTATLMHEVGHAAGIDSHDAPFGAMLARLAEEGWGIDAWAGVRGVRGDWRDVERIFTSRLSEGVEGSCAGRK